jgi:hypothetical protein
MIMINRFQGDRGRALLVEQLGKAKISSGIAGLPEALAEAGVLHAVETGRALIEQSDADNDTFFIIAGVFGVFVNGKEVAKRTAGDRVGGGDTPSRRTAFDVGINLSSSAIEARSCSARSEFALGNDWLREMISKSANLIFSVTVRPRLPVLSQCRKTSWTSGCSSAAIGPNSVGSEANVFSAPTDFRILLARTGRTSMPREIE